MGMEASLVMWPGPFEQTFIPPSQGGSTWNLASIGPVVSEKMFENVDNTYIHMNGWQRPTYPISSPMSLRLRWANELPSRFVTVTGKTYLQIMANESNELQGRFVTVTVRLTLESWQINHHWRRKSWQVDLLPLPVRLTLKSWQMNHH